MAITRQTKGSTIRIEIESESAVRNRPARAKIYDGDTLVTEILGRVMYEQGGDGGLYPVVILTHAADLPPWKWVLHHDDPPCKGRLEPSGRCKKCKLHPDTQSRMLYPYCPKCWKKLRDGCCARCGTMYRKPD